MHLNAIEKLTKQFADNFNLPTSKEKKGWKCKASHKEEILKNGVLLIVLNNEEVKDATSLSIEDEDEMVVVVEMTFKSLKIDKWCTECVHIQFY